MRGFKYRVCCQLKEATCKGEDFEIDNRDLLVITDSKDADRDENYQYSPRDAEVYNGFNSRLSLEKEELSNIDIWFEHEVGSAQSKGKLWQTNI